MQIFGTKNFVFKQKWYFFRSQKQMFLFSSHLLLGDVVGFSSRGEIVVAGRGNLNNCTFFEVGLTCFRPAGDPRPTREKHTGRCGRGKS